MNQETVAKLADLAVKVGANVQPGQIVSVNSEPGKEYLTRAVAGAAYRAGARFVDVQWFDPWVKRERIAHAADDTLEYVPPWYGQRMLALGDERAARIAFSGPTAPGILDGLDPVRAGRDRLPQIKESVKVLSDRTTNWSIVPAPNPVWAGLVHPELEPDAALARLWEQIVHICRLDTDDPVAAWRTRSEQLTSAAARLGARGFDALHYEGPGTDLTVGLLPGHTWIGGALQTVDGIRHNPNVPTEEVFTSPDPQRVEGTVTATKPLVLPDGTVVRDIVMRFEGGRAVEVSASSGQETMRTIVARDEGAARLGELALVDNEGRIGKLDTVFYDTLLDENAASHVAIGVGFPFAAAAEQRGRVNQSEIHTDFMIGSPQLSVTGITADGERVPVLVAEEWQI
ncbi:MAG: aminopeptidase [Solirubrobacteraceae bacterium]|nr:aminopeptidase [Solirubrobacteraceae bacterium]